MADEGPPPWSTPSGDAPVKGLTNKAASPLGSSTYGSPAAPTFASASPSVGHPVRSGSGFVIAPSPVGLTATAAHGAPRTVATTTRSREACGAKRSLEVSLPASAAISGPATWGVCRACCAPASLGVRGCPTAKVLAPFYGRATRCTTPTTHSPLQRAVPPPTRSRGRPGPRPRTICTAGLALGPTCRGHASLCRLILLFANVCCSCHGRTAPVNTRS